MLNIQAREVYMSNLKIDEADGYTLYRIEKAFSKLHDEANESHSLLRKHLSKNIKDKLKYKKSLLGGTLYHVIRSGAYCSINSHLK